VPNRTIEQTPNPKAALSYKTRLRLTPSQWTALENDLRASTEAGLAGRADFERNLNDWNDLYEMKAAPTDFPFVGAANIFVPLIPTQVESLLAYIASKVLVPHFYLVTGNTAEAASFAPLVERYYKDQFRRQRGDSTWFQAILRWLHLSLRDGTAYMEAVWKYRKGSYKLKTRNMRTEPGPPGPDGQPGPPQPALGEDGQPQYDEGEETVDDIFNDVELRPRAARDLILVPSTARSVNEALDAIAVDYMYEDQLMELVEAGVLDADCVEDALNNVSSGATELGSSRQPTGAFDAGGQLQTGVGIGTQTSEFFKNRGPIEIYRHHTRAYSLDGGKHVQEIIAWEHAPTGRMLGWRPYEYMVNLGGPSTVVRPFFTFSCLERPNEALGFGIPERLAGTNNEMNAQRNQRLNEGTLRIAPPFWKNANANIDDDNFSWGPNQSITSDSFEDVRRYELPQLQQEAFIEESILHQDANEYTGLSQIAAAARDKRMSAAEAKQNAALTSVRLDLICMNFRFANRTLINFVHQLKKLFTTDTQTFTANGQTLTLPPEIFKYDFSIDITGASDPIDASSRRQEELGAYEVFMKDPDIATNPMRRFYLRRKLANTFDWADVDQVIGTEKDAMQQAQAQQAQAQLAHLIQALAQAGAKAHEIHTAQQQMQADQQQDQQQQQDPSGGGGGEGGDGGPPQQGPSDGA
jgi:hypothetical protein